MNSEINKVENASKWFYGDVMQNGDGSFFVVGEPIPIDVNSLSIRDQAILGALEEQMGQETPINTLRPERVEAIIRRKRGELRERVEKVKDKGQKMEDRPFLYRKGDKYILFAEPTKSEWYSVTPWSRPRRDPCLFPSGPCGR